ncbi:DUF3298 and DUF4163 domain-containing protein [Bacillus sp. FJAT-45037]|uniref:DUF3298 and DUF4163 domain-containing protein n=1 Tax=Bacillus sp. FJAT-45037 TaxID=2011007 RepID=UPI0018E22E89|nr:DUF3298 and DUF4163 domain-containing protein [Bacillus sp. FJAT-45037]
MNMFILPVDIQTHHLVEPRLDVYYPQLAHLKDQAIEKKLNERILKQISTMIRKQGFDENPMTVITGGYEIKTNERHIISLTNSHFAFSGGAHGLTILRSLTMDVEKGSVYSLKDLFKPGADYMKKLNEIIALQIKERDLPLLNSFDGIAPNQYFYLADKALVLYFQLYDLLPYAFGIPYFVISVYEIQDMIDENGPLRQMIY